MTDNRTTELRRLLDARGVEYEANRLDFDDGNYNIYTEWGDISYVEYADGTVLRIFDCTSEQAIAATLGNGTCEKDEPDGWYKCAECGCVVGYWLLVDDSWTIYMDDYQIPFNNCPNCGKAVKR